MDDSECNGSCGNSEQKVLPAISMCSFSRQQPQDVSDSRSYVCGTDDRFAFQRGSDQRTISTSRDGHRFVSPGCTPFRIHVYGLRLSIASNLQGHPRCEPPVSLLKDLFPSLPRKLDPSEQIPKLRLQQSKPLPGLLCPDLNRGDAPAEIDELGDVVPDL